MSHTYASKPLAKTRSAPRQSTGLAMHRPKLPSSVPAASSLGSPFALHERRADARAHQLDRVASSAPLDHARSEQSTRPLPSSIAAHAERQMDIDARQVRVHTGPAIDIAARRLQARAFTVGSDIYFNTRGLRNANHILHHELSHVADNQATGDSSTLRRFLEPGKSTAIATDVVAMILDGSFSSNEDFLDFVHGSLDANDAKEVFVRLRHLESSETGDRLAWIQEALLVLAGELKASKVSTDTRVATLCHRNFTIDSVGTGLARHCFVWLHEIGDGTIDAAETLTYDNKVAGEPDPAPTSRDTVQTGTFDVDAECVERKYKKSAPENYNMATYNCCTCAYEALKSCGAKLAPHHFPEENQGIGLPQSYGSGWKRDQLEGLNAQVQFVQDPGPHIEAATKDVRYDLSQDPESFGRRVANWFGFGIPDMRSKDERDDDQRRRGGFR